MITQSILAVLIIVGCAGISAVIAVSTGAFMRYPVFNRLFKRYLGVPMIVTIIGVMYYNVQALKTVSQGDNKYLFWPELVIGALALVFEYAMLVGVLLSRYGLTLYEDHIALEFGSLAHRLVKWSSGKDDWTLRHYQRNLCAVSWSITWATIRFLRDMLWLPFKMALMLVVSAGALLCCGRIIDFRDYGKKVEHINFTESFMFSPILSLLTGVAIGFSVLGIFYLWGYSMSFYHLQLYSFIAASGLCIVMTWNLHRALRRKVVKTKFHVPLIDDGVHRVIESISFMGCAMADTTTYLWQLFKSNACPQFVLIEKPESQD